MKQSFDRKVAALNQSSVVLDDLVVISRMMNGSHSLFLDVHALIVLCQGLQRETQKHSFFLTGVAHTQIIYAFLNLHMKADVVTSTFDFSKLYIDPEPTGKWTRCHKLVSYKPKIDT